MSKNATKVYIKVESDAEQQQNLAKCRKSSKLLQKAADKENLTRSPFHPLAKNLAFTKSKSADIENIVTHPETLKRKKIESKSSYTQTEAHNLSPEKKIVTAKDLTSEKPGEIYWELLAEKRGEALNETLEENRKLHERIECLEQELETSKKMLDEAKNLVEVLTEMLEEKEFENATEPEAESTNINSIRINEGASTSAGDSCYFDSTISNTGGCGSDSDE
ncbi:geminin isoform X2 [Condylostylus longicornis]|uniref:geminin isoform X2 n=1 Tax=Condylostylus longicornis TaxID=2530218 RepID=UPI00244DC762|nr:geminin isoform X2 [Condylostylus longicornis]